MEVIINKSYDTESNICTLDRDQYEDSDEQWRDNSRERRYEDWDGRHHNNQSGDEYSEDWVSCPNVDTCSEGH